MSDSDLVEIAKRNGDFRKNWGLIIGSILYWASIKAARPRSFLWTGIALAGAAGAITWLQSQGWLPAFPWGRG
ncbi:hypothetical protein BRADO0802 [Bradyrhizobium sp. ORS 278]|nr:hypothetical protein BRADO0802 [Bradyrhizobium sp. ORS 278]